MSGGQKAGLAFGFLILIAIFCGFVYAVFRPPKQLQGIMEPSSSPSTNIRPGDEQISASTESRIKPKKQVAPPPQSFANPIADDPVIASNLDEKSVTKSDAVNEPSNNEKKEKKPKKEKPKEKPKDESTSGATGGSMSFDNVLFNDLKGTKEIDV